MSMRQSTSPADLEPELIADLVVANWILVDEGVLDGFGHVSVRDPQRFFMARHRALGLVFGLDGEAVRADGVSLYSERFITV
jgi:HCOMODA/2-hydroxy-3-carboxy-muconic semialdehyde decarboxylase